MKTFTTLKNLYGSLSTNTSTTNLTLGGQLINDQHRYLIQKYFDNERSSQTTTVGGQSLTLTGAPALAATTATLTAAWSYPTVTQLVNFSNSDQRSVLFTNGSTAISWVGGLSTGTATTAITTVGVQAYNIPSNISKPKNVTVNVGQLKYQPSEIMTRVEWDNVNFLPYTSDIPRYYFVYNNQINIYPIPSTTGNIISYNYQTRVADLSFSDYTTGTVAVTAGSTVLTGTTTAWATPYPTISDITYYNLCFKMDPPIGEGIWYPIRNFTSNTVAALVNPIISAPVTTTAAYTIGQLPILNEDFQDMLVYGALKVYFGSINRDAQKYKQFSELYQERLTLLEAYAGTKSVQVDLGDEPPMVNPNLFLYAN